MASSKKVKQKGDETDAQSFTAHTFLTDISYPEQNHTLYDALNDMGALYGRIKRSLYKDCIRFGLKAISFKNQYLVKHGITARQFNAIRYDLDGNISSAVEVLKLRVADLEDKIKSVKKWLKSREARIRGIQEDREVSSSDRGRQIHNIRFSIHHKKRKLYALELKLASLKDDLKQGRVRLCFGSRSLFRKQFSLNENDYVFHDEWLSDWRKARSSQLFCLGSKDETAGNQTCTLFADGSLRIRVPNYLQSRYGKHIIIPRVRYAYGQDAIDQALANDQALTHRLVRKGKGWYLHTMVDMAKPAQTTFKPRETGCIGVDVNEKEIAVSETDRFGNLVWSMTYSACVKDRNADQTMAAYGDICVQIVDRAVKTGKPIGHETLDFKKKKASLKERGVGYARMLSGFSYSAFLTMLDRRAFKSGVQVFPVNPAYTTVIGKINHLSRYGITSHEAAAHVIARRVQRYSESPAPARTASPLPARNRGEHVWKFWHRLKDSGACGSKHRLPERRPLQGSPGCAELQKKSTSLSTAQFSRPPASRSIIEKAPEGIPITKKRGLGESGRESLTLTGSSTVRLPS
jgi:hypothetical protein